MTREPPDTQDDAAQINQSLAESLRQMREAMAPTSAAADAIRALQGAAFPGSAAKAIADRLRLDVDLSGATALSNATFAIPKRAEDYQLEETRELRLDIQALGELIADLGTHMANVATIASGMAAGISALESASKAGDRRSKSLNRLTLALVVFTLVLIVLAALGYVHPPPSGH